MRRFLMLFVCLPLTGCLVGASQGRSTTSVVRDTGVPGVERTTVTSEHSGRSFGASVPMTMMMGMGLGLGGVSAVVTGPSCVLHPDACAVIQTATVVQPVTVVSNGGGGNGGAAGGAQGADADLGDLEARIERIEASIPKLAGAGILSLRQSCHVLLKDPGAIADAAEREKIVAGCEKVLKKSNPDTADTAKETR